jgi:hypothetical protein
MNDEWPITLRRFKRLFPDHPESFFERNKHLFEDQRGSDKPECLDRKEDGKVSRDTAMEKTYKLKHVEVIFYAGHRQTLDPDNRQFAFKNGLDALIDLGFAKEDKHITTTVTQRMDDDKAGI